MTAIKDAIGKSPAAAPEVARPSAVVEAEIKKVFEEIKRKMESLKKENAELGQMNSKLTKENAELQNKVEDLELKNGELQDQLNGLKAPEKPAAGDPPAGGEELLS